MLFPGFSSVFDGCEPKPSKGPQLRSHTRFKERTKLEDFFGCSIKGDETH